jgi:hypothetical protein
MGDETSVFVSYRRDDSKHAAGRLGERLHERFHLFMDIDNIRPGTDFTAVVRNAVDQADVVLAIIGTAWLASTKEPGTRRLDDPDDWVALEVGTALRRGTPVIPVLVDGARMPERGELPEKLADLASRQAITLDHESFGADCTRLIEIIESLAGEQQVKEVDLWADPDYPAARSALLQEQWARAIEGLELPALQIGDELLIGARAYEEYRAAALAAGAEPTTAPRHHVAGALGQFPWLATREVEELCGLRGPGAEAELWRLAAEFEIKPVRAGTGWLWEAAA